MTKKYDCGLVNRKLRPLFRKQLPKHSMMHEQVELAVGAPVQAQKSETIATAEESTIFKSGLTLFSSSSSVLLSSDSKPTNSGAELQ